MSRRTAVVAGLAGLSLLAAACGSTSGVESGGSESSTQAALGQDQICGKGGAEAKPGYANDIPELAGGKKRVSGAGSTFVAPMMSVWTKDYSESAKVQVAYQSIGSGGGVKQISEGTVDFGASDTPMKTDEEAGAKHGKILHVPLVLGGVVPTYNVAGQKSGLKFTGEVLGKIFTGEIAKWNDPALTKLNPDAKLPDQPIAVVHRSDGSGTTAVWTDYLTKSSPSWVEKLGGEEQSFGKEVAWPTGIGGKGNEGVSGAVNQTDGSIGYVELTYALAQNLAYGLVKNKAGKFIQPCVETVSAATKDVEFPDHLKVSLTDEPGKDAYPITGTVYALVYQDQTDKAAAAALVNFLAWVLSDGQDDATQINYSPMGKDLRDKAVAQVKRMTLNGQPLAT
ncbi:MAG: phosphate ABC transporter substrate-binding protein PstS [Streptosporangiales bacterium]|nr:phosphate ABC transporter substrate-binding protein PstS [Streptosporangiales bacterium]